MDPLTCNLAMLVLGVLGGSGDARALPVTVQDDALLLHRPPAQVRQAARRMARLGVDRVRLTAGWSALAPNPRKKRVPRHIDEARSDTYPPDPWTRLDRAVKAITDAGLEPQLDVAFFAPRWATSRKTRGRRHRDRQRWEPDPIRFERFATAVAERYDGSHRDPARSDLPLPAVRLWTTWNEPNHPAFLLPQWTRVAGRWSAHSPHIYRELHNRGYDAIKRAHPDNKVLIGGLSAEGKERRGPQKGIAPLHFLRELACVDRRLRELDRPECVGFEPLRADGLAHHPYSLYNRPDVPSADPEHVTIGDLDRMSELLEDLHRRGRTATRFPIFVTEYGYETNPPDVVRGVSLHDQARYHGLATYIAWQQRDVAMFAQFLLQDIAPPPGAGPKEASRDWNSGLYFHDGREKPAVQAFKLPFWAEARPVAGQDAVIVFGQVRPESGRKQVEVEMRRADGIWRPVQTYETRPSAGEYSCGGDATSFLTDVHGFFLRVTPYVGRASYRARWIKTDGTVEYGVPVRVGEPEPRASDA